MTTVQIDKELQSRLTAAGETVVVCDEQGNRIGLFLRDENDKELYRRASAMFSDEELDAAEREPGGTTLDDILKRLPAG